MELENTGRQGAGPVTIAMKLSCVQVRLERIENILKSEHDFLSYYAIPKLPIDINKMTFLSNKLCRSNYSRPKCNFALVLVLM